MQKESTVEVQKYRLNVGSSLLLLQPLWLAQPGVGSPTAMGPAATNMLATASAPSMQFLASLAFLTSPPAPLGDRVLASMSNVLNIPPSLCITNSMAMTSYPLGCGPALPDPRGGFGNRASQQVFFS